MDFELKDPWYADISCRGTPVSRTIADIHKCCTDLGICRPEVKPQYDIDIVFLQRLPVMPSHIVFVFKDLDDFNLFRLSYDVSSPGQPYKFELQI